MKIKAQTAILITLAIFIFGTALTSALGIWTTKSAKIPKKLNDGQQSDAYDPSDIRGSYTFSDISQLYGIPLSDLSEAFGVTEASAPDFKCKDLEGIYGASEYEIGTASVRMFAAYYLGLPYDSSEAVYLPAAAAKILTDKGKMSQVQREYLESHTAPAN